MVWFEFLNREVWGQIIILIVIYVAIVYYPVKFSFTCYYFGYTFDSDPRLIETIQYIFIVGS